MVTPSALSFPDKKTKQKQKQNKTKKNVLDSLLKKIKSKIKEWFNRLWVSGDEELTLPEELNSKAHKIGALPINSCP